MASDQSGTKSTHSNRPASRLRRHAAAATTAALLAVALLGCTGTEGEDDAISTPSFQQEPPTREGTEVNQDTKDFHKYLTVNDSTKDLTTIFMDVKIGGIEASRDVQIITGLDANLETPGSPDQEKADRLTKAFTTWRAGNFKDHGSVKTYNPAIEMMATATW